jgi:DNA-binding beta-propeller fold protein YncE
LLVACATAVLAGCAGTPERTAPAFFPPLPAPPKLQFLHSITTEEDIGGKPFSGLKDWLIGQRQSLKQIARPQAIASSNGKIYVLDRTLRKVLIVDLAGKQLDFIQDDREGALDDPMGICVTEDDLKYVADVGRKQILLFDGANQFVRAYGEAGQFERPMDVAVYQDRVYVADFAKSAVVVLDRVSGKTIQTIGDVGDEAGQFNRPTHVKVDRAGNVYVNDSFNFRIQKLDSKGNYVKHFGYQGDTLGGFARPKGIAVDRSGYVYGVDAAFENAQIFDPESTDLLLFFGGYGAHTGSMYLPSGLHIDYDNVGYFSQFVDKDFKIEYLVYVGNLLGPKKVNVYGFGEWIGAPLPATERKPVFTSPGAADGEGRK